MQVLLNELRGNIFSNCSTLLYIVNMFSMKIKHNILSKSINYMYQQNLIICFMVNIYRAEICVYTGVNFLNLQQPKLTLSNTCDE